MAKPFRVLIVEDNEDDALLLVNALKDGGFKPVFERVDTSEGMKSALSQKEWDCIISDYAMPHYSGLLALLDYQEHGIDIPFILVSGTIGEEIAVAAMKAGAHDYIMKGNLPRLIPALERELKETEVRKKRKHAERSLRESEELHRNIMNSLGEGLLVSDLNDVIWDVNPRMLEMTGYTRAEMIGRVAHELLLPPEEQAHMKERMRKRADGITEQYEVLMRRKNGSTLWTSIVGSPLRNLDGVIIGSVGANLDITERKKAEENIRKSEASLRDAQLIGKFGNWEWDLSANVTTWSENTYRLYGLQPYEIEPTSDYFKSRVHPDDQHLIEEGFAELMRTKKPIQFEMRIVTADNTIKWVFNEVVPIFDGEKLEKLKGINQDITERKHAEDKLRKSEARLNEAQRISKLGNWELDLQTNTLTWSDEVFRIFEINPNEFGASYEAFLNSIHPDDRESVNFAYTNSLKTRIPYAIDHRLLFDAGRIKYIHEQCETIFDANGTPLCSIGTVQDITERKRMEDTLRTSEEQFRLISENVVDMIAVLDLEGKRIYNSPSYKSILGDPESLRGTDSFQEIHPEDRERIRQIFQETVKTGIGERTEYRFLLKDGSIRHIESQGSVIRNEQGKIARVIVVSRDVTEKRLLEKQFLRTQRMESIGTLAGGIAHDLNNILSPILMSVNIISKKLTDEQSQKMLQMLESTVKRGADLIKQVLSFARGVEGERTIVQVRHLIDEMGKIINETFPKSISFRTAVPKNLPTVSADATQLHQVLMNLCVNARDAMPNGGKIEINAETVHIDEQYARMHMEAKTGIYVVITVTDQGMGIPPAIMERIFEPFFTTKEIGKGTGLGLSTVIAIIKSHGGFVNVYSEVGKGTTFKVYLPVQEGAQATVTEEKEELPAGNGELILVVDDEKGIREITKITLETYGYSVITAEDGTEAVAAYATHGQKVALVLTDMMMPYMDGAATIRAIQKMNPKVKVLAVSGLKHDGDVVQQQTVMFLHKPYTSEKLLKSVSEMLRRK